MQPASSVPPWSTISWPTVTASWGSFPLYGDGSHIRDFTFVADVVAANRLAATAAVEPGLVVNVCGGSSTSMRALIATVEAAAGRSIDLDIQSEQDGDVVRTGGDHGLARDHLGWESTWSLDAGVAAQVAWHRERLRTAV